LCFCLNEFQAHLDLEKSGILEWTTAMIITMEILINRS